MPEATDSSIDADDCLEWGDEQPDPWPDDPNYEAYLVERTRLDRLARRIFRCRPTRPTKSTKPRQYVPPRHFGRKFRQRRYRRAHRVRRVVRSGASGVGNESSDGEGESPSPRDQYSPHLGNKIHKEHRTAHSMSGFQEGRHHG